VLVSNQALKSSELVEWKKKISLIAAAVRLTPGVIRFRLLIFVLDISGASDTRTPVSNICSHGERRAPEAHAWDVARTRAHFCPRRSHDRSFRVLLVSEPFAHSLQDKNNSYFVGDAAGRADDFASTDRKFALNVGIQFYTPEVRRYSYESETHLE
jgi:bifunctional polynucleotide phosphatase/kinase